MKKPLHVTIPIAKIDEEQRMVYGYATVEELDAHGEIISYEASKKAFSNWIGNIREMHQDIAVGKNMETEFDDDTKGVWIGARISESDDGEQAWIKVKEGVYSGFSIGGRVNDSEVRTMSVDGKKKSVRVITDYDLGETSLVDNPACPSAIFQMVKSVDGHLEESEEVQKGIGRPVHWWEKQYQFSDSQKVMKGAVMTYNEDSMASKSDNIAKSLWEAGMLIDLAMCLSDYIYWKAWEGEEMPELKSALEAIQAAAAKEVVEPEEFPQIEIEVGKAMKALNISKREELEKMSKELKDAKEVKKSVVGAEDRDDNAEVVVTAEENGKPADTAAEDHAAAVADEGKDADEKPVDEDKTEEVNTPAAEDEDTAEDEDKSGKGKSKKSAPAEMKKSTDSDLAKSILSGVESLIEKAVSPLKEEIDSLKKQAAPSKAKATFTVKKGEDVVSEDNRDNSAEGKVKTELDSLLKRADQLAANPNEGTHEERLQVAFKIRKMQRQLDPASVAKHAAIRATFPQ